MKSFKTFIRTTALGLLLLASAVHAEDIDIFGRESGSTGAPNVIFVIDNSANWSKASQQWQGSATQGEAEMKSIANTVRSLAKRPVNVGLVMLNDDSNAAYGAYVRFAVRPMLQQTGTNANGDPVYAVTAANTALQGLVTSVANNINSPFEKISQAHDYYATSLYETWLYLSGAPSFTLTSKYDNRDFSGNSNAPGSTAAKLGLNSGWAYQDSSANALYNSPTANGAGCANTYIIFIGNNRQGSLPAIPSSSSPPITKLTQYGYSTPSGGWPQATWASFLYNRPDLGVGSSEAAAGRVVTYTIDAYQAQQNTTFTKMMQAMARMGGGQYFKAGSDTELTLALEAIFQQIQAVNSEFAAASLPLPVSMNQRTNFLNQVYLGMFRPDPSGRPNWPGNLKQYRIGADTSTSPATLFLADARTPALAATSNSTGFITSTALSFWTKASTFWNSAYYGPSQGVGGASDYPDGDLVEKGGVAQTLRTKYATNLTTRNVYTCTGTCSTGTALSSKPFKTSNTDLAFAAQSFGMPNSTEQQKLIDWVRGSNSRLDDNPDELATSIRGFVHGDVLHSRAAIVDYGPTGGDNVYVYYGANDGLLHAIKGGQTSAAGTGEEQWSFVAPEHFASLSRLYNRAPPITDANRKPYFFDGSPSLYLHSSSNDGQINHARAGDKAYLYLTMRRGGRFIYALDVTNPTNPKLLWKRSNLSAGWAELGYTWSEASVGKIRGHSNPVLIFGLGYDPSVNDQVVTSPGTMGRGVMVVDAFTGDIVWNSASLTGRAGIDYSIPAGIATVDSNNDGFIDRLYAADTGANLWRINIDDVQPNRWTVDHVAQLSDGLDGRRFLFAPDVVLHAAGGAAYDSILIGSGDREQPFDVAVQNRFYMIKDPHTAVTGRWEAVLGNSQAFVTEDLLHDFTSDARLKAVLPESAMGWFLTLDAGEKVVGGSIALSGTVFFGTNAPTENRSGVCVSNLGTARTYQVDYRNASPSNVNIRDTTVTVTHVDRYQIVPGGGFPPAPVALQVKIDGHVYQAVSFGPNIRQPPAGPFGRRYRTYWYTTGNR